MKAALLHRALRPVCVAFLLILGAASSADAENVFWQGRHSRVWDHFNPFGDQNNWYTRAPLKGVAREPPGGLENAMFARGAKSHFIRSSGRVQIRSTVFLSDLKRYTITIDNHFEFWLNGGIFNQSPAPPRFVVSDTGTLYFDHEARIKSGGHGLGKRSAFIEISGRQGKLYFFDRSRGGDASVTNKGSVSFSDTSSAERMMITNVGSFSFRDRPETKFFQRSTGGSARFVNGRQGTLDFSNTTGPANDRRITARSIYNDGHLVIGLNTLTVQEFEQAEGGDLSITIDGTRPGDPFVRVTGKAVLDGDLRVSMPTARPGIHKILYAEGGRTGIFTPHQFGRLAYSEKEVNLIID